jgi:hypothetical protein
LTLLLNVLKDKKEENRAAASSALFELLNQYVDSLDDRDILQLLPSLLESLEDATDIAKDILTIFSILGDLAEPEATWLIEYDEKIVQKCISCTELTRNFARELQIPFYEIISKFVDLLPDIKRGFTVQVGQKLLSRGQAQLQKIKTSAEFHFGLSVGCHAVIRRLNDEAPEPLYRAIAEMCLKVLELPEPEDYCVGETSMCISYILNLQSRPGEPYVDRLAHVVINMLRRNVAVIESLATVTDLGMFYGHKLEPHIESIFQTLVEYSSSTKEMGVKERTHLTNAVGDLALGLGQKFAKYVPQTMTIIAQTCEVSRKKHLRDIEDDDADERDDVANLRDSVLASYTGIIQGGTDTKLLTPYLDHMVRILIFYLRDQPTERLVEMCWGLVGDIACRWGPGNLLPSQHRKLLLEMIPMAEEAINPGVDFTLRQILEYAVAQLKAL